MVLFSADTLLTETTLARCFSRKLESPPSRIPNIPTDRWFRKKAQFPISSPRRFPNIPGSLALMCRVAAVDGPLVFLHAVSDLKGFLRRQVPPRD